MHLNRVARGKWSVFSAFCVACTGAAASAPAPQRPTVRPGIDVLLSDSFPLIRGKRIGFVTNVAAVDAHGVSAISRLRGAGVQIVALFAPEHGLAESAAPGERVASGIDSSTNTPIYSLYGATTAPTAAMLAGIDVIVVDLPDVGARYYTYLATTVEVMKSAATQHIPVVDPRSAQSDRRCGAGKHPRHRVRLDGRPPGGADATWPHARRGSPARSRRPAASPWSCTSCRSPVGVATWSSTRPGCRSARRARICRTSRRCSTIPAPVSSRGPRSRWAGAPTRRFARSGHRGSIRRRCSPKLREAHLPGRDIRGRRLHAAPAR